MKTSDARRIFLTALVALTLTLAGCDSDRRAVSRDDLPDIPAEADHVVVLDDDGFSIDQLEVATDDLVEIRVEGSEPRGVYTEDYEIDTGSLFPGESTFLVFDEENRHVLTDRADDGHVMVIDSRPPERRAES